MDYLSDLEKTKIKAFMTDKVMSEAVRKVLLAGVYENGTLKAGLPAEPRKNAALSLALAAVNTTDKITDEQLGQDLRAFAQGITVVESAFKKLAEIEAPAVPSPEEFQPNPGV